MEQTLSIFEAIELAKQHFLKNQFAESEKVCRTILQADPENADANHILGVIALQFNKADLSIAFFQAAIKADKNNAEYYTNLGNAYNTLGKQELAIQTFEQAAKIDPGMAKTFYNLGNAYLNQSNFELASTNYQQAIKLNPDYVEAYNNLGTVYKTLRQFEQAIQQYLKAVEIKPDYTMAFNNLGDCYSQINQHEKAIEYYQQAISLKPDYVEAIYNMGLSHQKLNQFDKAIECYNQALKLNPNIAEAENNLGLICVEQNKSDIGLKHYLKALQINPGYKEAQLNIGSLYNKVGMFKEAIDAYKKATEIDNNFVDAYYNLGCVYSERDDAEKAISYFQKAIELNPQHAPAYKNLANVYKDFGNFEQAENSLRTALQINPAFIEAYRELASIKKFSDINDPDLERMLTLNELKELSTEQKMHMGFALAKVYEDLKDYDQSFNFLNQANTNRRILFPYSQEQTDETFRKIESKLTASFIKKHKDQGNQDPSPIFILGMPRSGSSLIEQILSSHPQVFGAGELNYVAKLTNEMWSTPKMLDYPECILDLSSDDVSEFAEKYLSMIRELNSDSTYIVDKMPHNFFYVGLIDIAFPNAKIIHSIRNPMDSCLSMYKTGFHDGHPYTDNLNDLGHYYNHYLRLMKHWKSIFGDRIYDCVYEDVVADTESQTRKLLDYCGLDWDENCLEFYKTKRRVHTASATQVRQGIYKKAVKGWLRFETQLQPLKDIIKLPE